MKKRRLILTLDFHTDGDEAIHPIIAQALRDHATMLQVNNQSDSGYPDTREGLDAAGVIERDRVRIEWQLVTPADIPADTPVHHVEV